MAADWRVVEHAKCLERPAYFIGRYCSIYDATAGEWIPFELWDEQAVTLATIENNRMVVILKARQIGMTWLCLAFALWLALYRPAATILLFSRRDDEAVYLLGVERLRGIFRRLPDWMKPPVLLDNDHEWRLSNGSVIRAFPTNAGDSYTATLAVVDEADLVPDLNRLMNAVKPTVDGGGSLILLSRVDKGKPESEFKRVYRGAKAGENGWIPVFLPWHVRPDRDAAWYERIKRDILSRTGALDDLYQQYPATDTEALSPNTLDKRISSEWLRACYEPLEAAVIPETRRAKPPAIPGLVVYREPDAKRRYAIGVDPAEGNPTSDDSALTVLDDRGEEVAKLAGKFEPSTIAAHADRIGAYYHKAGLMVERNNHGHAVILWLRDHSNLSILTGEDGKPGWLSNSQGKALMYADTADAFRDGQTRLHSFDTFTQLSSIDGSTLRAPEGEHDDKADSYALAIEGVKKLSGGKVLLFTVGGYSDYDD